MITEANAPGVAFPHMLGFENRSYECRSAIFGPATLTDQPPCLPVRVRGYANSLVHRVSDGLGGSNLDLHGDAARWKDVLLDCSNAQVASHLNGVIAERLGLTRIPQQQEPGGLMPPSTYLGESAFQWLITRESLQFTDGRRATLWGPTGNHLCSRTEERELNLPRLPELLTHSGAASKLFARVRVMVIEAMDAAGMFEKVSATG